ncbi:unnamed protein product [Thelazia callipaeda]|uniref:DUF2428 domain-containing protein n=1 Tax=Thelazia callipaeda TaxID=103827 RepID=A0A158RBV6_THECL|nr:unnamed protein product [Thelazia callipaeda]
MEDVDRSLTLLHLRKTFSEFCKIPLGGSKHGDRKFDRVLPLFSKVMVMYPSPEEIVDKFKELCPFASYLCRHLVQEIRLRASNECAQSAASAILNFLLPDIADCRGWTLLNAVCYLCFTKQLPIIEVMCKAALPSTLVKALYLFFDLPSVTGRDIAVSRQKLLGVFQKVLKKLCEFNCVNEELTRKDDLFLLFAGASCSCPVENIEWRNVASQLLVVVVSKGLSSSVTKYIHAKNCVSVYLSNACKEDESLSNEERIEMFICLLCVLKDSAATVNVLLLDFARANGYILLRDFILKYAENEKGRGDIKNVLFVIMSLATSGVVDLKPNYTPGLIVLPSFNLPVSSNNGLTLRNLDAFRLLFQIFVHSKCNWVCEAVIDAIHNIYASDAVNYFIADKECALSQLIEHIGQKSPQIQRKIMELVEYVILHLNHIPCKELVTLSVLLKTEISDNNLGYCVLFMESALRILSANGFMKDAFREVGLVESLTWTLLHFISIIKIRHFTESEGCIALLCTDILSILVSNHANARTFHESAGSKAIIDLILYGSEEWRASALQLMKQLLIFGQNEEQFTALLFVLHPPSSHDISLKTILMKSLLCALRESHKVRLMFRRAGGYLCLMSLLVNLEGKLSCRASEQNPAMFNGGITKILKFIEIIFKVLAISMRYEPSNARYFSNEVKWDNLCTALRVTGAFVENEHKIDSEHAIWRIEPSEINDIVQTCHRVFDFNESIYVDCSMPNEMPLSILTAMSIVRFLVSLALDSYEKSSSKCLCSSDETAGDHDSSFPTWTSGVVVHPGALISVMQLLPAIDSPEYRWKAGTQYYCACLIKALLRPERNQQIMCQSNMAHNILKIGVNVFKSEKHLMLAPFYYVLERLSSHAITPSDLRSFLRLDMPLCCRNLDEEENEEPVSESEGGPIPIARVKALVSMMTPRDHRIAQSPSFVEFDMAFEGFACLIIPSLAPLSSDFGGVGHGERIFPPLNGLTLMMWLCVEQFSDKKTNPHPIRLFSIYRSFNLSKKDDSSKQNLPLVCFSLQISSIDRSLMICTAESETAGDDLEKEKNASDDNLVRVTLGDAICTGQWIHIAVVLTRSVLKHSQATVFINGRSEGTYKLHYIIQNVGGGTAHLSQANSVHAIIGTPPVYRSSSSLCFKIATVVLIEEPVSPETVYQVYKLEPHYVGNFQASFKKTVSEDAPLIVEERISLSLTAVANSELSVSRFGLIYSKADSAFIARYVGVSIHDRSTPLRILLNTVTHAAGPARTIGAVLLGYLGMRLFAPCPVTRLLDCVGGISCLFGLIAMSTTSQELYASLKALTTAAKTDETILAMLLEGKSELLNSHILHLILSLVGTLDTSKDTVHISNLSIFEDMLCDLDVWKNASPDLNRLLYEHFYELITDQNSENLNLVRRSTLPSRLLIRLFDHPNLIFAVNDIIFNLFVTLLQPPADSLLLLKIGQLVAGTLPLPGSDQNENSYSFSISDLQTALLDSKHTSSFDRLLYDIYVRNRFLNILANILAHSSTNSNSQFCDLVVKTLGFDWVLALFTPGVHYATVVLGLRIILALLKHDHLMQKFKDGSANGGWLTDADSFVRNRAAVLLGFSVSAYGGNVGAHVDINPELSECSGFVMLEHLLYYHYEKPQCYLAMLALLVGQPVLNITLVDNFSFDLIWSHVFGLSLSGSVSEAVSGLDICCEAIIPLLSMVRASIHANEEVCDEYKLVYSSTVIQLFTFLYQNCPNFCSLCHTEEFITSLFCVLIPVDVMESGATKDANSSLLLLSKLPNRRSCYRTVLDLIKRILCEDIYRIRVRSESLLDALIENIPEYGFSRRYCANVLTEILSLCMEYIIATDVLLECSQTSTAAASGTAVATSAVLLTNFAYFSVRIVDSVWSSLYIGDTIRVLSFLFKSIALVRRYDLKPGPCDSLMQSLGRIILYLLSRPIDNVHVQMSILNTLSEIIVNRNIVFSPTHNDHLFFGSLTHLLFMLSVTPDILLKGDKLSNLDRGSAQVAVCASQVWKEVCAMKRSLLEEVFRNGFVCELNAARALLSHAASLQWLSFVDSQMNSPSLKNSTQIQQQIQSKITKVASGLQRLASRKALSNSNSVSSFTFSRQPNITTEVIQMWLRVHISLIRELIRTQCLCYHEWHSHVQKWCMQDWRSLEMELTRERGIWGAELGSSLDKFMLDMTEGPCRIRRKLVPNPAFYYHYPYRPYLDSPDAKAMRAKVAVSKDSRLYYEAMKRRRGKMVEHRIIDLSSTVFTPSEERSDLFFSDMQEVSTSMIRRVSIKHGENKESDEADCFMNEKDISEGDDENEVSVDEEMSNEPQAASGQKNNSYEKEGMSLKTKDEGMERKRGPDNQTLLRLLEQGEQLHSMFRCARIQGLDTSEGLLLFGQHHYYVVDGFTLLKTREIRDLDFLPRELHDPIVPYMACGNSHPVRRTKLCSKFSYNDIREVHRRRYLLQPIAIEVFSGDGRNYLLAFPKRMRNRVYQKFVSLARLMKDSGSESVGGQRLTVPVEQPSRVSLLTSLIGHQSVTHRWVRGEISNFQYLIHLNTLAGRSYNDLSQYPVFPWILRDYESEDLDLTNPSVFRDLSKPMGAQNPERLEQFLKRYREWDDPTGETPAYMYGTHYSSAMIVVSYLVRLEPFTQQFLKLQGGHFDLADRMFHSVGDAWLSASRNNMADVKELIPEFFSLPEMFLNLNHFDFGVKQNGIALNDVILPPWAKGDAREFVRIHRQALECDYVSANLHNWIDLIFGYKQLGDFATEANNVYHHLFYEGNVDFENIEDPLTRNATIGFINNFGQIPSQLFKKPHPQKKVTYTDVYSSTPGVTTQRLFYHSFDSLKVPSQPIKELKSAVGSLIPIEKGGVLALEVNRSLLLPNRCISWGFPDRTIRVGTIDGDRSTCIYEMRESAEITCCTCGDSQTIFTGSSTGKVCVWDMIDRYPRIRFRRTLTAHTEAITTLVSCSSQTLLVSGSRDGTAILWHLTALIFIRQLRPHPSAVTAVTVNDATGDIATASRSMLFLWSVNGRLLSVVDSFDIASFDQYPNVILSVAFSTLHEWDPENVIICGGSDGIVRVYCMEMVKSDDDSNQNESSITLRATKSSAATTLQQRLERQRRRLLVTSSAGNSLDTPSVGSQAGSPEPLFCAINTYDVGEKLNDDWECQDTEIFRSEKLAWKNLLVPKFSLTTHTAFNREDNPQPAPITAITPSKDHRTLFVGDGVGRVWSWQISDEVGARADHWVQDPSRNACTQCMQKFSLAERRHHCRNCGHIFCNKCSRFETDIKHMKISKPVRVCQSCFLRLKAVGVS